ncbi:MAG: conjugal transfer protein TraJ [Deltaproteobacteria bacterium]|jgi:hypothetical protein|nr:conjugal transfer protein TraJ [Deltaproteobacteria bacterium]
MATTKKAVRVYLSPAEHQAVYEKAARARLSMSTFAKRICLGYEIKNSMERQAVLDLIRLKADFGRLGGLLKHALGEKTLTRTIEINRLIDELAEAKREVMTVIRNLK